MKNLPIFIFLIGFAIACDTVAYKDAIVKPEVVPVDTMPQVDTTSEVDSILGVDFTQKIFLEDYTGHTCGNCPYAATQAKKLQEQYGNRIIIMAIHVGNFAVPSINPNKPSYKADFRTSIGNSLNDRAKAVEAGLPKGTINRKKFTSAPAISVLNYTEWGTRINQIFGLPSNNIGIKIVHTFNTATRVVDMKVKAFFKTEFSGNIRMASYLIEDKIINWQKFYPTPSITIDSARYEHNHMLRGGLAPKNGNYNLSPSINFLAKQSIETQWQGVAPEAVLPENAKIIFVLTNADSEEVLQVAEVDLVAK
jgi:thiol-disulfide isomerase/thioredoxin